MQIYTEKEMIDCCNLENESLNLDSTLWTGEFYISQSVCNNRRIYTVLINTIAGTVIPFIDVDDIKDANDIVLKLEEFYNLIHKINTRHNSLYFTDDNILRIKNWRRVVMKGVYYKCVDDTNPESSMEVISTYDFTDAKITHYGIYIITQSAAEYNILYTCTKEEAIDVINLINGIKDNNL